MAEPAADRLGSLIPGRGHLVRLSSHLWMKTERYDDAAECNRKAAALDNAWFEGDPLAGEYRFDAAHHRLFVVWPACSQDRRRQAVSAVRGIEEEPPAPRLEALAEVSDDVLVSKSNPLQTSLKEPEGHKWGRKATAVGGKNF